MATQHVIEIVGKHDDAIASINAVKSAIKQLDRELRALKMPEVPKPSAESKPIIDTSDVNKATRDIDKNTDSLKQHSKAQKEVKKSAKEAREELLKAAEQTSGWQKLTGTRGEYAQQISMLVKAFRARAHDTNKMLELYAGFPEDKREEFVKSAERALNTEFLKHERKVSTLKRQYEDLADVAERYGVSLKVSSEEFGTSLLGLDEEGLKQRTEAFKRLYQDVYRAGPQIGSSEHQRAMSAAVKDYGELAKLFKKIGDSTSLASVDIEKFMKSLQGMSYTEIQRLRKNLSGQINQLRGEAKVVDVFDVDKEMRAQTSAVTAIMTKLNDYRKLLRAVGKEEQANAINMERAMKKIASMTPDQQKNVSVAIDKSRLKLRMFRDEQDAATTSLDKFSERFGKLSSWMVARWSFYALIGGIRATIDAITSMQIAVIDLQKVMNEATTNFGEMRQAAFDLGKELGRLPEEVAKAMNLFARQGREQAEILELTRIALIATNIAEMTLNQSVEMLTAAMFQWNLEAEESMQILDAWNEVAKRNAVTAPDLAEAFSHTSSMARNLGLSVHELNALITILAANTGKAGGEIGRALRFAFNRAYLPVVQTTLSSILGLSVFEPGTGKLRDFGSILREISERWEELSDAQQAAVARSFGGTRHIQDMVIIFENLGTMGIKVATDSMNSFGSATRENERYMASWERRVQSFQANLKQTMVTLGDSGVLSTMELGLDILNGAISLFNAIPGPIKNVVAALGMARLSQVALGRVFGSILPGVKTFPDLLNLIKTGVTGLTVSFKQLGTVVAGGSLVTNMTGIATAIKGIKGAIVGFLGPWGTAVAIIMGIATAVQFARKKYADLSKALETNVNRFNTMARTYEEQYKSALRVQEAIQDIERDSQREIDVTERKNQAYEDFRKTFGAVYRDYDEMSTKVREFVELKEREFKDAEELSAVAKQRLKEDVKERMDILKEEIDAKNAALWGFWQEYTATDRGTRYEVFAPLTKEGMFGWQQELHRFALDIQNTLAGLFGVDSHRLRAETLDFLNIVRAESIDTVEELRSQWKELEGQLDSLTDKTEEAFARLSEDVKQDYNIGRFGEYIVGLSDFIAKTLEGTFGKLNSELEEVVKHMDEQMSQSKEIVERYKSYFEHSGQGLTMYVEAFERTSGLLDDLMKKRLRVAFALLDDASDMGIYAYYETLKQVVEAQEHFTKQLDDQRSALEKAFDMGIIGASDFYASLVEIDRLDVFTRKRQQIREMTDELKSSTTSAIESFIRGSIKGEENVLERFQESMQDMRTGILAKGLTGWLTESDYFKTEIARQQTAIAHLFGAGTAEKIVPLEDRKFRLMEDMVGTELDIAKNTELTADLLSEIAEKPRRSFEFEWPKIPPIPGKTPPSEPPQGVPAPLALEIPRTATIDVLGLGRQRSPGLQPAFKLPTGDLTQEPSVALPGIADLLERLTTGLEDASWGLGMLEAGANTVASRMFEMANALIGHGVEWGEMKRRALPQLVTDFSQSLRDASLAMGDDIVLFYLIGEELEKIRLNLPDGELEWAGDRVVPLPQTDLEWAGGGIVPLPQQSLKWGSEGVVSLPEQALQWAGEGIISLPQDALQWANQGVVPLPQGELRWKDTLLDVPSIDVFEVKLDEQPVIQFSPDPYTIDIETQPQTKWTYDGKDLTDGDLQLPLPPPPPNLNSQVEGAYTSVSKAVSLVSALGLSLQEELEFGMSRTVDSMTTFFTSVGAYFDFMGEMAKISLMPPETLGEHQTQTIDVEPEKAGWFIDIARKFADVSIKSGALVLTGSAAVLAALSKLGGAMGATPAFGFDTGGYTGRGGRLQPAGVVHKGEWVAPQWLVKRYPDIIGMLEGIRQRGYQKGGDPTWLGAGAKKAAARMLDSSDSLRLDPTIEIYTDDEANRRHNKKLLNEAKINTSLAIQQGWKIGTKQIDNIFAPWFRDTNAGLDKAVDKMDEVLSYATFDKQAQVVESKFAGTGPVGKYLGKAFGGLTKYLGRSILGDMGLLQYVGTAVYILQIVKQVQREFKGAGMSRLLGLDVLGVDIFKGFQAGGFTGADDLNEIAGVVHGGEWVAPAWQVKRYPHLIAQLERIRRRGYQSGGYTLDASLPSISWGTNPFDMYLADILDATLEIRDGIEDKKDTGLSKVMEILVGRRATSEEEQQMERLIEHFDEQGIDCEAFVKSFETGLRSLAGDISVKQLNEALAVMVGQGAIVTQADVENMFDFFVEHIAEVAEALKPVDAELAERLQKGREKLEITTIQEATQDPEKIRDAITAATLMLEQTDSTLAAQVAMSAGLIKGTGIEMRLADAFKKIGLTNLPTDIITGIGQVLGGMSQNVEDAGSGIANIILGTMTATGIGGPLAAVLSPVVNMLFGQKKEEQREAEKISQYRKFISSDTGFAMSDRFYLSGRHAALLRGETRGAVWGDSGSPVEQRFEKVEINVSGAGNPTAVAKEVKKVLTDDIPRSYSRQMRRGLYR